MKVSQYPVKVWVLQPSFKPKEVELTIHYSNYGGQAHHRSSSGKIYADHEIALTFDEIIRMGEERLKTQQADLDKKQATLTKRKETLAKAKGVKQ